MDPVPPEGMPDLRKAVMTDPFIVKDVSLC